MNQQHRNQNQEENDSLDDSGLIEGRMVFILEQIQYKIQETNDKDNLDLDDNWKMYSDNDENYEPNEIEKNENAQQKKNYTENKFNKKL